MPAIVDRMLSRFGYTRKEAAGVPLEQITGLPIFNDARGRPLQVRSVTTFGGSYGMWGPQSYGERVEQGYGRNSDVYACVSLIATAAKQVKWWDGVGGSKALAIDDTRKRYESYPGQFASGQFDQQLGKAANPKPSIDLLRASGGTAFIEQWVSFILLSGNDYIEVVRPRPGSKDITALYLTNPRTVAAIEARDAVRANERELVDQWRVVAAGGKSRFLDPFGKGGVNEIVHSKLFNPVHPVYGMAPLEAAMLRVGLQNQAAVYGQQAFERGFVPGWIEARENSQWDDTQVAALKDRISKSKMAGQELFLENAVWHQNGFNPGESAMTELSQLTKRDIASVFHVDPALIGDTTARTYATYRESRRGLYMEAVVPLLVQFKDDWNRTIGADLQSPLEFDKDSFDAIAAAREEAADRVTKLWQIGLITQDEARKDMEYDPAKAGDVFYAPANLVPLGETVEPGE